MLATKERQKQTKQLKEELEQIRERKLRHLEQLEKELEKLKEQEKAIQNGTSFTDVEKAVEYLNEVLKRGEKK